MTVHTFLVVVVVMCITFTLMSHVHGSTEEIYLPRNVTWYPCPLYSSASHPVYEVDTGVRRSSALRGKSTSRVDENGGIIMAECAFATMPLDHSDQDHSRMIHIFMKRYRQKNGNATKSVWLNEGGPGYPSTVSFEDTLQQLSGMVSDADIYAMDHRGVGSSTRVACPSTQAETTGSEGGITITNGELAECSAAFGTDYGTEHPGFFSPTQAAWDLISLMTLMKNENGYTENHVFGVSYGTFLVSRVLQISETNNVDIVTTATLDGVVSTSSGPEPVDSPRRLQFSNWDTSMDKVAKYILETYCNNSTICYSKLNKKPLAYMDRVYEKLYQEKHCSDIVETLPEAKLRMILGQFITNIDQRELIPAILYRLNRCDPRLDIPSLQKLISVVDENKMLQQTTYPPPGSLLIHLTIAGSEMYPVELGSISYDILEERFNSTKIATGNYRKYLQLQSANWPLYQVDQYFNNAPTPRVPTLLLNGDSDTQTTLESATYQYENMADCTNCRLIPVPYAPHGTLWTSPQTNSTLDCAMEMFLSFLNTKDVHKVDTSCLSKLSPITFRGVPSVNRYYLGSKDIYEGVLEEDDVVLRVSLYTFLMAEAFTVAVSVVVTASIIYYIAQMRRTDL